VLGEIGIGNTATTATLASALTGAAPERTVGRGTGVDAAGLERKRTFVAAALAHHGFASRASTDVDLLADATADPPTDAHPPGAAPSPPLGAADAPTGRAALLAVGGLELAALAGAAAEASRRRLPVVLDGYATAVAALAAARDEPLVGETLIASHRSAEPGHDVVLAELGLEPLLDLRLRLGEASGALLALPVVAAAGALHREMGTFEESRVDRER
jgi:nicotinate-nucleotide--dimethylbenzimidazole phosphoribosyltransferase